MANLHDPQVQALLEQPNYAVISTFNRDGSTHSTMVWVNAEDGAVAVNSHEGRLWPANLERDPRVTLLVFESNNPYHYAEIRGRATATREGADEHIDALAKKYMGVDRFPGHQPGVARIKFVIEPEHVRFLKQG